MASIGRPLAVFGLSIALGALILGVSFLLTFLQAFSAVLPVGEVFKHFTFGNVLVCLSAASGFVAITSYLRTYLKYDFKVLGYGFWKSLATIHFAHWKWKFTDYSLNPNVEYAKHAISIDENRKDFRRVKWSPDQRKATTRDAGKNLYFEQVWFSGVHADIGGGYPESESRLSDITLGWMLAAASIIPGGIYHDRDVLQLHPDPTGIQHDECKAGRWQFGLRELPTNKEKTKGIATMHPSVYERFTAETVQLYDLRDKYRPKNLSNHLDFEHYYGSPAKPPPSVLSAVADNIEMKWSKLRSGPTNTVT